MTSPIPGTTPIQQPDRNTIFNTIPGTTNTTATSPGTLNATSPIPVTVAADTQTQWAKPLTKTLRALEKLEAAFANQGGFGRYADATGTPTTAAATSYLNPNAGTTTAMGGFMPPVSGVGSLPPPTPESSTSGEWTIPNILDRAAEYIHPPLWG